MDAPLQLVLLADIDDIFKIVFALLVPIIWVIKQIADVKKQMQEPPAAPVDELPPVEVLEPQPAAVQPAAAQAAGQQADPLRNQVEEFLRRAGRMPPGERPKKAPPRNIEILVEEPAQRRPLSEPLRRPGPSVSVPLSGLSSSHGKQGARKQPRKRQSLAERATERAAARDKRLAEQTAQLGQRIIAEDREFDVQLKSKFDHNIGTLAASTPSSTEVAAATPSSTPASQIAAMLASPEGVRQAIVVNEILRRPTDRW